MIHDDDDDDGDSNYHDDDDDVDDESEYIDRSGGGFLPLLSRPSVLAHTHSFTRA